MFVSWSGPRSRAVAEAVAQWLENVNQILKPWLSEQIPSGARWSVEIGENLSDAKAGILCVTPENIDAPWLVFEAGALSHRWGESRVIPLLLDLAPGDLTGPLTQFQAVTLNRDGARRIAESLNELLGRRALRHDVLLRALRQNWRTFDARIAEARVLPIDSASVRTVLRTLRDHGLPEPSDGRSLKFSSGFESHALYEALFASAQRRLYIFGRKNRKVFDKEHDSFFSLLPQSVSEGFDFRCLFLDPSAPRYVLRSAHADQTFLPQLRTGIRAARDRLKSHGLAPRAFCRAYRAHRSHALVVIDNLVLFAPAGLDAEGHPRAMTKCPFTMIDADDPFGRDLVASFLGVWETSRPLP